MAATKRRRYSDEERASLIVMLQSEGYPGKLGALKKIAEYAKIPERTLQRWWKGENNPPPDKLVAHKKENMADALERVAWKLLSSLEDESAIADAQLNQRATAFGIAIDKMNLLRDKPTERIEHSGSISVDERRQRVAELLNTARTRRDGEASPSRTDD